jgi:hypothetical protein
MEAGEELKNALIAAAEASYTKNLINKLEKGEVPTPEEVQFIVTKMTSSFERKTNELRLQIEVLKHEIKQKQEKLQELQQLASERAK